MQTTTLAGTKYNPLKTYVKRMLVKKNGWYIREMYSSAEVKSYVSKLCHLYFAENNFLHLEDGLAKDAHAFASRRQESFLETTPEHV